MARAIEVGVRDHALLDARFLRGIVCVLARLHRAVAFGGPPRASTLVKAASSASSAAPASATTPASREKL